MVNWTTLPDSPPLRTYPFDIPVVPTSCVPLTPIPVNTQILKSPRAESVIMGLCP